MEVSPGQPCCPICGHLRTAAYRPFCSTRCQQIDLGRWLSDSYVISSDPETAEDEAVEHGRDGVRSAESRRSSGQTALQGVCPLQPTARAQVAQLVEHATENRSVGGSIPPLGTF